MTTDRSGTAQPHRVLKLAWAFYDPGIVHLRDQESNLTLCGVEALSVQVSRRKVTCEDCRRLS